MDSFPTFQMYHSFTSIFFKMHLMESQPYTLVGKGAIMKAKNDNIYEGEGVVFLGLHS